MRLRMSDSDETERCIREQAEIVNRLDRDTYPSWLMMLGWADWEAEKVLIERGYKQPLSDPQA